MNKINMDAGSADFNQVLVNLRRILNPDTTNMAVPDVPANSDQSIEQTNQGAEEHIEIFIPGDDVHDKDLTHTKERQAIKSIYTGKQEIPQQRHGTAEFEGTLAKTRTASTSELAMILDIRGHNKLAFITQGPAMSDQGAAI